MIFMIFGIFRRRSPSGSMKIDIISTFSMIYTNLLHSETPKTHNTRNTCRNQLHLIIS